MDYKSKIREMVKEELLKFLEEEEETLQEDELGAMIAAAEKRQKMPPDHIFIKFWFPNGPQGGR